MDGEYICNECDQTFETALLLNQHMTEHTEYETSVDEMLQVENFEFDQFMNDLDLSEYEDFE